MYIRYKVVGVVSQGRDYHLETSRNGGRDEYVVTNLRDAGKIRNGVLGKSG